MKLIDADALKQTFCAECDRTQCEDCVIDYHFEHLAPTVDAEPVRHGHWCFVEYPDGYYHWECSECNKWFKEDSMSLSEEWKYCPNCGATMDEDWKDADN